MKKIKAIYFVYLRNEAHYEFLWIFDHLVDECQAVRPQGRMTDVRLSLGKDFSVTYKNNTEVGMAEVTIHGKGEYKGSKSTTFMIAR